MTVDAINAGATTTDTNTRVPTKSLTQADFLKVIVAQLGQQDPFNSQDSSKFMDQFMTMGNFQAMQDVSIQTQYMRKESQQNYAANLVGKKVEVIQNDGSLVTGVIDNSWTLDNEIYFGINGTEYKAKNIISFKQ